MRAAIDISGTAPDAVLDAFAANFAEGAELGARFCAVRGGEIIADISAGHSDRAKSAPWTEETLACVYSSGKAVVAALIARAAGEGALDYERPVAYYWPAFAANGKENITVATALSHQAGLCGFPDPIPPREWLDHDRICARLAAMAPLWAPGTAAGYHPQTIGYIANELLRRTTGKSVGEQLRASGLDLHCGLAPADMARAAYMPKPRSAPVHRQNSRFTEIAFFKPWSAAGDVSREEWMAAQIPASNMHATARAVAVLLHPLANGGVDAEGRRIIDADAIAAALRPRMSGEDLVLPFDVIWAAGLMVNTNGHFGPSGTALGHAGFGGSAAMIDPEKGISAAYVMNLMSPVLSGDPRAVRLFTALDRGL